MIQDDIRYPIGKFERPKEVTPVILTDSIKVLQLFPEQIKQLTYNLPDNVLDIPYREGGWTIRQLIHHISDSHHHAYNRVRWALSENNPRIKAYDQEAFAKMDDYQVAPIAWSIQHIEVIHRKLVYIFQQLDDTQLERSFQHPETEEEIRVDELACLYAWHSMHHFAHIKNALDRI